MQLSHMLSQEGPISIVASTGEGVSVDAVAPTVVGISVGGAVLQSLSPLPAVPARDPLADIEFCVDAAADDALLPGTVPRAEYMYGCVATSIGMLLGYYDIYGYRSGDLVYDMSNLIPGTISVDSRGSDGGSIYNMKDPSVLAEFIASDEYVQRFYGTSSAAERPYTYVNGDPARGLNVSVWNCLADYLGTGQYWRGNGDLSTMHYYASLDWLTATGQRYSVGGLSIPVKYVDFKYGLSLYVENAGYSLDAGKTCSYSLSEDDFTFSSFTAEIDAGRPVLLSMRSDGGSGHMVLAYGYNAGTREVIFDDTYRSDCRMFWGGTYRYSDEDFSLNGATTIVFDTDSLPVSSGGESSSGNVTSNAVVSGAAVVSGGTSYIGTRITSGGKMRVLSGGSAEETHVSAGGSLVVFGGAAAANTTVSSGGYLYVSSGGAADGVIVDSGGRLYVSAGGTAGTITADVNGAVFIYSGGTGLSIRENGGVVSSVNGAHVTFEENCFSGVILSGASATAHSGTTANGVTLNRNGRLTVYDGGTANATFVRSNGALHISGGGSASGATVSSGGSVCIFSGGVCRGPLQIASGAYVYAYSGSTFDFTVSGRSASDDYLVNNLAAVTGTPNYTITVASGQPAGTYKLARGAANFDRTVTLRTPFAGSASLAVGSPVRIAGRSYALSLNSGALTLTVSGQQSAQSGMPCDLSGDGRADIVMTIDQSGHPADGATGAWLIQSNQTPAWGDLSTRNAGWEIFGIGRTASGKETADVYVRSADNVIGAWTTGASGQVTGWETVGQFNADTQILGLGDFNGNGQSDLLLRSTGGAVGCYFTDGAGWNYFQSLGDEWQIAAVGDFNGDGRADTVLVHDAGFAGTWLTQSDGTVAWADLDTVSDGFAVAGAGDFDGDGTDDVLLRNGNYYGAWLVENGNAKAWFGLGDLGSVTVEQVSDFDGDGKDDLRVRTDSGDLGSLLVRGEGDLEWHYYGSVGAEWSTRLAAI